MSNRVPRRIGLLLFFALVAAQAGCDVVTFEHPLVKPSEAKLHRELYGSYHWADEHTTHFMHVGSAGKEFPTGFMRAVFISLPKEWSEPISTSDEVVFFAEKVGDYYVLQMPASALRTEKKKDTKTDWHKEWEAAKTGGYLAHIRIKKTDDGLELAPIDPKFIEQQITEKKLPGTIEPLKSKAFIANDQKKLTVSASTEELQKFFQAHINEKLFGEKPQKWTLVK